MKTIVVVEPGKQEITTWREFEAPCHLLFLAHTDPELFARWYGCEGMTTAIQHFHARSGGSYEYRQQKPGAYDFIVRGVFHEVTAPERIVRTVEHLASKGRVSLETLQFQPVDADRSRVTTHIVYQSVADRDHVADAGVTKGAAETFDRLEELLGVLKCRL